MLKYCSKCGKFHEFNYDCTKRERTNNEVDKFHRSYLWRSKAKEVKKRDNYLCQWCLTKGIYTMTTLEVHHIDKAKNDKSKRLDETNCITLCSKCHKEADKGTIKKKNLKEIVRKKYL